MFIIVMYIIFYNYSIEYMYMFMMFYLSIDSYKFKILLDDKMINIIEFFVEILRYLVYR